MAHVKRIYFTNDDGSQDTSIWIDVLRREAISTTRVGLPDGSARGVTYILEWDDKTDENQNKARITEKITVTDDNNDPGIDLYIIDQAVVRVQGQDSGQASQDVVFVFDNKNPYTDPGNASLSRQTSLISVPNNDLNGLDMTQSVDWDTYRQALIAGNKSSEVLVAEVTDSFVVNMSGDQSGGQAQGVVFILGKNKDVEGLFDKGSYDSSGSAPTPARLDPFQTIVNAQFDSIQFIFLQLAVTITFSGNPSIGDDSPWGMGQIKCSSTLPGAHPSDDVIINDFQQFNPNYNVPSPPGQVNVFCSVDGPNQDLSDFPIIHWTWNVMFTLEQTITDPSQLTNLFEGISALTLTISVGGVVPNSNPPPTNHPGMTYNYAVGGSFVLSMVNAGEVVAFTINDAGSANGSSATNFTLTAHPFDTKHTSQSTNTTSLSLTP